MSSFSNLVPFNFHNTFLNKTFYVLSNFNKIRSSLHNALTEELKFETKNFLSEKKSNKLDRREIYLKPSYPTLGDNEGDNDEFLSKYKILDEIATGGNGTVYLVSNKRTNKLFAAKVLGKRFHQDARQEEKITKHLRHPNIIQIVESLYSPTYGAMMIMEYLNGGTVGDYLLGIENIKKVLRQTLDALDYLHKKRLVHLDIKLENLLFVKSPLSPDNEIEVKLIDFGFAGPAYKVNRQYSRLCTPAYCSPEVINEQMMTPATDVWCVGIMTYLMLTDRLPYTIGTYERNWKDRLYQQILTTNPEYELFQNTSLIRSNTKITERKNRKRIVEL
ncbi:hypothetical protein SNEBB_005075 [Seison nebaliae]|nr:hypothetical protein SNEBB_005075 [Seison nebaliae]